MVLLPLSSIEHDRIDEGENFDNDNDVLTATEKTDPLLTVTLKHVEYQLSNTNKFYSNSCVDFTKGLLRGAEDKSLFLEGLKTFI